MQLKMPSGKWRPFRLGLNVLKRHLVCFPWTRTVASPPSNSVTIQGQNGQFGPQRLRCTDSHQWFPWWSWTSIFTQIRKGCSVLNWHLLWQHGDKIADDNVKCNCVNNNGYIFMFFFRFCSLWCDWWERQYCFRYGWHQTGNKSLCKPIMT